jgi:hypothetical protein
MPPRERCYLLSYNKEARTTDLVGFFDATRSNSLCHNTQKIEPRIPNSRRLNACRFGVHKERCRSVEFCLSIQR